MLIASTFGKNLLCFLHIRKMFVVSGDSDITYVWGTVKLRTIKEGTSYEDFKIMICPIVGKKSSGIVIKFTLTFIQLMIYCLLKLVS